MKVFLLSLLISLAYGLDKPRGIPFSKLSFYQSNTLFKCIDGSDNINWDKINDDYCDCKDGSDEPGTSACSNGNFFCDNKGYRGLYIFSSRVNDGICDCCDGSDEYNGLIQCNNSCFEIGEKSREEDKKIREGEERGHAIYLKYIKEFESSMILKKSRIESIKEELDLLSEDRLDLDKRRNAAEDLEKEAKKVIDDRRVVALALIEAMEKKRKISEAFFLLDIDNDTRVSIKEMQRHEEFDSDQNGEVSIEEIKEYLNDQDHVDETYFTEKIWPKIEKLFKFQSTTDKIKDDTDISSADNIEDIPSSDEHSVNGSSSADKAAEYDEETLGLIAAADIARRNYDDLNQKYTKLEEEKRSIKDLLSMDYGPNSSFYTLADSDICYDLADREYVYKLCPFKKTVQSPKSGGPATDLGRWGRWAGTDSPYATQVYEDGEQCWNGPRRSTKFDIRCGADNVLVSVREPSRCEYLFGFESPAACHSLSEGRYHEEL